jgi:hypothetical protein
MAPPPLPNELFTSVNIASMGIATVAVNVVTNTLYKLVTAPKKWTAFLAALVIAIVAVSVSSNTQWYDWVLGFFNACLLFCSALGINELAVGGSGAGGSGFAATPTFFTSWLKR